MDSGSNLTTSGGRPVHNSDPETVLQDFHLLVPVQELDRVERICDWGCKYDPDRITPVRKAIAGKRFMELSGMVRVDILGGASDIGGLVNYESNVHAGVKDASKPTDFKSGAESVLEFYNGIIDIP